MIKSGLSQEDLMRAQEDQKRQALAQMLMGGSQQPVANPMQGLAQMATAYIDGSRVRGQSYPGAPGGAQPSMKTSLMNMFTRGNNGGLY